MKQATHNELKAITEPGRYKAGDTLYLIVTPTGSKSWVQRLTVHGKRRDIGLGSFKLITLSKARQRAHDNRVMVAEGGDPIAKKRREQIPTFGKATILTYETLKPRWRNGKHTRNWIQIMTKYAIPVIGSRPIDQLGREDVLKVLVAIVDNQAGDRAAVTSKDAGCFQVGAGAWLH